jgi:ElaA protein
MSSPPVIHKTWGEFTPDEVFEMAVLRSEVFFLEQKIDEEEFDAADRDDEGMAAYLRIVHNPYQAASHDGIADSFGRMVVRKSARGRGLAQVLMARALEIAGDKPLYLHAQDYVTSLYAKFGFERRGELFHEAGIPHVLMVRHPDA